MSEVRVCEDCGARGWVDDAGAPTRRTVEVTDEDGIVVEAEDRVLCRPCFVEESDTAREVRTDGGREEVLDAVEEANDLLAEALGDASRYATHDEVRPSAVRAFDRVQEAHTRLSEVDPTRSTDEEVDLGVLDAEVRVDVPQGDTVEVVRALRDLVDERLLTFSDGDALLDVAPEGESVRVDAVESVAVLDGGAVVLDLVDEGPEGVVRLGDLDLDLVVDGGVDP